MKKTLLFFCLIISFSETWAARTSAVVTSTATGGGGGTPGGGSTDVQFNDAGTFGGSNNFLYDKVTSSITLGGKIGINDQGNLIAIGNGSSDPDIILDNETGTPSGNLKFQSFGVDKAGLKLDTGVFDIRVATSNSSAPTPRISFQQSGQTVFFTNASNLPYIAFDALGISTFSVPVFISTLTINKQLKDGSNSAGSSGQVLTSNGSTSAPTWQTASSGGGGASSLEVFNNFNGARSSPTASIGMSNAFTGTVSGSTFTFALNPSSVTMQGVLNDIHNQNTLQSGATAYISSFSVTGSNIFMSLNRASDGANLLGFDDAGSIRFAPTSDVTVPTTYSFIKNYNGGNLLLGTAAAKNMYFNIGIPTILTLAAAGTSALINSGVSTAKGIIFQGVAAQSANAFEVQSNTGVIFSSISARGGIVGSTVTSTGGGYVFPDGTIQTTASTGGGGSPGGASGNIQYNNGGSSFGGIRNSTYTAATNNLAIGSTVAFENNASVSFTNFSTVTYSGVNFSIDALSTVNIATNVVMTGYLVIGVPRSTSTISITGDIATATDTTHPVPTLSSCGTGSTLSNGATDSSGTINVAGVTTGCVLTFGKVKNKNANCTITGSLSIANVTGVGTTTTFTIGSTAALTNNAIAYNCGFNE